MAESICVHCEKRAETERIYLRKTPETYYDRCLECGQPVSATDTMVKQLAGELRHTEKRTNLVIGIGIAIFVVISLIREFF